MLRCKGVSCDAGNRWLWQRSAARSEELRYKRRMFAKARLDTLSDGIFGVAMTLLILDVRLPDDFHPADGNELIHGLLGLWPKFLPYLLSFGVLGLRWLANVEVRTRAEFVNREYVNWWLVYLLLITCVPFTTIIVGRFGHLAPAIWLYAGHTLLVAVIGLRLTAITPGLEPQRRPPFAQAIARPSHCS